MSTIIKLRCVDQVLTFDSTPIIASGGVGEDFIQVDFCSKWDGLVKTATFWRDEKEAYHVLLDENDSCAIPPEVLAEDGPIYLGIFGVSPEGKQRTTQVLRYNVVKGAVTLASAPDAPTADIYTQLLAQYAEVAVEARALAAAAESAAEDAAASREAAETAASKEYTAEDVGALPIEPGEKPGNFWTDFRALHIRDTESPNVGALRVTDQSVAINIRVSEEGAYRGLYVRDEDFGKDLALTFMDTDGKHYYIYGEHNTHQHSADDIKKGTFAGSVRAKSTAQTCSEYLLRNSKIAGTATTPDNNGEICWQYE